MIEIIIANYFYVLLSVAVSATLFFVIGLYLILTKSSISTEAMHHQHVEIATHTEEKKLTPITISSHDLSAISGDDVIATQLDLARAYIETGRKQLAKKILLFIIKQGNGAQQEEAHRLLNFI